MIIYALIARGSLVLCEYTDTEGDFPQLVRKILVRVKKTEEKQIFSKDNYLFCVICHLEYKFFCMVEENYNKELAFSFLDNIKNEFLGFQLKDPQQNIAKYAIRLQQLMKQNINCQDAVSILEDNIESLNDSANSSLNKMMERDVKLSVLVEKTVNLSKNSDLMYHSSRRLKSQVLRDNTLSLQVKFIISVTICLLMIYVYLTFV